jgi:hypothetical protein
MADHLHDLAIGLGSVAHEMGSRASTDVPVSDVTRVRELGDLARQFVQTVKPLDAVKAIDRVRAAVAALGSAASASTAESDVVVMVPASDALATLRDDIQKSPSADRVGFLYTGFKASFQQLAYVALLIDPAARGTFAPRRSPSDLPPEIPRTREGHIEPLLDGITTNVDDWRRLIFDDQRRVVVPDPLNNQTAWRGFLAWAERINPKLGTAAANLADLIDEGLLRER